MTSVVVQGSGGARFVVDVPRPGSVRREVFDAQVRTGDLRIVEGTVPPYDHHLDELGPPPAGADRGELIAWAAHVADVERAAVARLTHRDLSRWMTNGADVDAMRALVLKRAREAEVVDALESDVGVGAW